MSDYPTQRLPIQPGADDGSYGGYYDDPGRPRRYRRRRRRGVIIFLVTLVVLAVLFVIADRVAVRYADNQFASQIQTQGGFSNKPTVNIEGFPFLTQLAARKFNEVQVTAATEKAGPVVIKNLHLTMRDMQLIDGFSGARVGSLNGSGLITFASVAKAADVPGLKLSALNSTEAKATINLGFISGSAVVRVTKAGTNKIDIAVINAGGIPLSALGGLNNMTIKVPGLPMGIDVQSITMTQQGILAHITGQNVTFTGG